MAALESGQVKGYRQAAEVFQVAERSVGTWWRAYQAGGREALAVRRTGRPGPGRASGSVRRNGPCCSRRWPSTPPRNC
ncbi:helix-turn-helix domain-containing protein [Streptomyces sp. CNQ085]|uniref:helix-turn-helix domain-containing protein n=1 Tax=Streptomyces sp. CNQ085 TaxID=2886944 RepID=UPI0035B32DD3|nr:helix-turn-helix domain containing protein [Streptomyces sp. CNQ085]